MKTAWIIALCTRSLLAAPDEVGDRIRDYALGGTIGQCIAAGCNIFSGYVLSDSAIPGQRVAIRVERRLSIAGISQARATEEVPYDSDHDSNASVWSQVKVSRNTRITVAVPIADGLGAFAGEAMLVTSDRAVEETIEAIIEQSARLDQTPEQANNLLNSISRVRNSASAGYLFVWLILRRAATDPETASDLLMQLVSNPSTPPDQADLISGFAILHFYRLSVHGKTKVARELAELGKSPKSEYAKAGFGGLSKILSFEPSVLTMLSAEVFPDLRNNYRLMLSKGLVKKSALLENGLGLAVGVPR